MTHLINSHVSGFIMVIISIILQISVWVIVFQSVKTYLLKSLFVIMFPVYFVITSFFTFYTVNLLYNIIVPPRWIEQNSKYLSFTSPIVIRQNPLDNADNTSREEILNLNIQRNHSIYSDSSLESGEYSSTVESFTISESLKSLNSIQSANSTQTNKSDNLHLNFASSSESRGTKMDFELNGDIEMGIKNINCKSKSYDDTPFINSNKLLQKNIQKTKSLSPINTQTNSTFSKNTSTYSPATYSPIANQNALLLDVEDTNSTDSNNIDNRPVIITIQIPVYTEDFSETLVNTYENIKMFVEYWNSEHSDSKANILIHEDGLQKVNEQERNKRIEYYNQFNDSFYIARQVEGRAGRFKKASNMNFGMRQILKINKKNNSNKDEDWENASRTLNFMYKQSNASTFEIGKYILLIDSDSRFNPYAIEALIYEMEMSPNIGYLQVRTASNKVIKSTWENAISHFTNSIYSINFLYSSSNGFPAPLVGHNVVLRWEALQNVEKLMNGYGSIRSPDSWRLWDEGRVSEDFVMSIYLQYLGYYGKYVFYDCGFKEGVSLNIVDEITKLKKYIYGVNEVMFYPCRYWLTDGIMSHLYGNFLMSDKISFSTKYALLSYMGSYYSLALSPIVTCWYYFVKFFNAKNSNLFVNDSLDTVYACAFIFFGVSVISNMLVKTKHKFVKRTFYELFFKEISYGLYLTLFFSCVSWHLLTMMSSFFLNFPAKWETTKKEAERLPITTLIWTYKWMYLTGVGFLILILYGLISDGDYQNKDPKSVVPLLIMILSHMLLPIYTILT